MIMAESNAPEPVDAEFEPADDEKGAEAPRRGGALGHVVTFLVAALAGGALGGAAAWVLDRDDQTNADFAELDSRLAALEAAETPPAFDPSPLEARVTALENAPQADTGPLEARIDTLESASPDSETLAALTSRVEAVEALANQALDQLGAMDGGVDPVILTDLGDRVSALEAAGVNPADSAELSAIEARLASLEGVSPPESFDASTLEARLATLEDSSLPDVEFLNERITALEEELANLEANSDDGGRQLAARTLALMALTEQARTDAPFEAERAALARIWPGRSELDLLATQARAGVPDRAALTESFPRDALEEAVGTNRIFFGLIEVRPSQGSEASPLARIQLIEEQLDAGDLAGAVTLTSQFEGEARSVVQAWLLQAEARLALDSALASLRAALIDDAGGVDPT
jgi:hypothetical protein